MKKAGTLIILIFFTKLLCGQEKDYSTYHQLINKAERKYFVDKNVDSSLVYYDKAFHDYDFIFVKDLLNAAQIACFEKKPFQKYVMRSFNFGIRKEHFQEYPILEKAISEMLSRKEVRDSIKVKRKKYLNNLNLNYRSWLYEIAIDDQLSKSQPDYSKKVNFLLGKLSSRISNSGFPGERIIGIDDDSIYSELGAPKMDFSKMVQERSPNKLSYFKMDSEILASKLPILLFIHHRCSYSKFVKVFMEEIKKGNIHPRDVGLIHDNVFRFRNSIRINYCSASVPDNGFLLNLFTEYPENILNNLQNVNQLRAQFFIVSVEIDQIKKVYQKDFGFNLFSGFWSCR